MIELQRTDSVASEAAFLVGVLMNGRSTEEHPLEELEGLATTAGARVVGSLTQRREAPDVTTYLGSGKVEELQRLAAAADADVVIFDNDLSPAQTRNLEKTIELKVLDRTRADSRHLRHAALKRTKPGWRSSWRSCNTRCRG